MAKLPSFQFYPGDWMKDADVRRCSLFARGLLVDLLCLCFESKRRGVLCEADGVTPWTNDDIVSALSGGTREQLLEAITELERKGVLSRDSHGCLYSRRMVRDEQIRVERAAAGAVGGKQNASKHTSKTEANHQAKAKQIPEEEEEEEEEDKNKKKVCVENIQIPTHLDTPEVRDALGAWLSYKAQRGQPYKSTDHMQRKLAEFASADVFVRSVNSCIGSNYAGLFPREEPRGRDPTDPRGNKSAGQAYLEMRGIDGNN